MVISSQPYPDYKCSGTDWPEEIPSHWKLKRLRTAVANHTTGTWGSDPDGINDLPCIRVADFDRKRLRVHVSKPTFRAIEPTDRPKRTLQLGDLILEKSGGGEKQPVGSIMLYDHQLLAVTSNFIERLTLHQEHNPAFFTYVHSALYARGVTTRSIKQTTGIQNLDVQSYLSETVGVPDLHEQNAIVRYLDHADETISHYISAKERLITLLEEQRQAVIHQVVTRGLDPNVPLKPSGIPWIGDAPNHWAVRRLRTLVDISTGGKDTINKVEDGKYPFYVRSQTVEKINTWSFDGEAVLTAGDGVGVGKVFHYIEGKFDYHQRVYKFSKFTELAGKFFYHYFRAMLRFETSQGTAKSTVDSLRLPMLQNFPVLVPPQNEQIILIQALDRSTANTDDAIELTKRQIDLVNEYRTRLIADVVTGQIDVRNTPVELPD